MSIDRCPVCKQFIYGPSHTCPPAWEVRDLDEPDSEWHTVYDSSADEAVRHWVGADNSACAEYPPCRTVAVRRVGEDGDGTVYDVEMEMVPHYTARRARNAEKTNQDQLVSN
jgi:hypothetical protein